jgi:hypothetical protein
LKEQETQQENTKKNEEYYKVSRVKEYKFLQEYHKKVETILIGLKKRLDKSESVEKTRITFLK